ncbi:hypothetical protein DNU06_06240 [Putridiphycobacter roseus]|uniref:GyrI-like small molecule binding domain-containing protein n=1 Tax=Putridiphycobacter roseus TaxID=2219161 RepID=A0A2W1N525_9FLAO|nr:SRPBCC family protein [Putridiphycobacter roseus]PZE18211.1 hypothetical protein DNU06_06240 [Putridiphycobacter roseus]
MPKTHVSKSIFIAAEPNKVYTLINDFSHWTAWSPWAILETEAKVSVASDGKYFEWEGNRIGSGNMKITKEKGPHKIWADLTFLKPFKSKAKIEYTLTESEGGTQVTWEMYSSLPFFMFFMKDMMQKMIGMDFDRGLKMLKDLVENGKVNCKLTQENNQLFETVHYVGIKGTTPMTEMGLDMSKKIPQLKDYIKANNLESNGEIISIYHKWDMKNQTATYTLAAVVKTLPQNTIGHIISGTIPTTKVNKVIHTGDYDHLGNAWTMQMMMQRNKEFKQNKKMDPFEVYKNSPFHTPSEELITEVMFPTLD